jgi:hypothetical protein
MNHEIRKIAHRAACGLRDETARKSGATATEILVRMEAQPGMFVCLCLREVWIAKRTKQRLARRWRVWL